MADIKQAAEWMQEGKEVTRPLYKSKFGVMKFHSDEENGGSVLHQCRSNVVMYTQDLLADDWEIAE